MQDAPPLQPMLRKLEQSVRLDARDRAAVLALPHTLRVLEAGKYIVREGDPTDTVCLLRTGFAYRHKIVGDGERQIVSVQMAGDMVDLHNALLGIADHNVQALTRAEIAMIPQAAILELAAAHPSVGRAMWLDTLVDGSIYREWIANVGRRDAKTRTAHVLCELAIRQEAAGLGDRGHYQLPMTQEQLADVLGLTPVHVNRTLKALEESGLIGRDKRSVTVADWDKLSRAGDFSSSYLHLGLAAEP